METTIKSHKDLLVWQKSLDLVENVYLLTEKFPQRELYGLSAQMRRAAVSISSNIAEGRSRGTRKDFTHFLHMAFGSASELETQLLIAKRLSLASDKECEASLSIVLEVSKMLRAMISKLEAKS